MPRIAVGTENDAPIEIEGGPHNIGWTYADEVNPALLEFIDAKVTVTV